jgi:hypothetical protein
MSGASSQCGKCATWYLVEQLDTAGRCVECASGGTEASRRRERLAAMSAEQDAIARAAAEAWSPGPGFSVAAIEARDANGDPLIIPRGERMAPPVEPDEDTEPDAMPLPVALENAIDKALTALDPFTGSTDRAILAEAVLTVRAALAERRSLAK